MAVSTTAGACKQPLDSLARMCDDGGATFVTPLPSPRPPFTGEDLVLPSLETQISSPSGGQPTAQYFELLAQAEARAKESARQWWINFLNNK